MFLESKRKCRKTSVFVLVILVIPDTINIIIFNKNIIYKLIPSIYYSYNDEIF